MLGIKVDGIKAKHADTDTKITYNKAKANKNLEVSTPN